MPQLALPIDSLLPDIVRRIESGDSALVIEAPPGAGKTTRVPRALLESTLQGDILVLEPRRIAARRSAQRVASELGEALGARVGYSVRFEEVSGPSTRLKFLTEGILSRRLMVDPLLRGVGAVVLDEFHERHVHGDLALAWIRELQRTSRPDLKLLVMSATLDAKPVADFLSAPTLRSEGRTFDVAMNFLPQTDDRALALQVVSAIREFLKRNEAGDVLVFLPGAKEIREAMTASEKLARDANLLVCPLHGDLTSSEQDQVFAPSPQRKVIFATNVAESSVTIEGVTCVIDTGLSRTMRHDPWSGMGALELTKVSRASAIQRAGRAGRTAPGICFRLYTKADFDRRPEYDIPEIQRADVSELWLFLSSSGKTSLGWLDAPLEPAVRAAEKLLRRLGAIDAHGTMTELGKRMLTLPLHPRSAKLLLEGAARGVRDDAATVAALLMERDVRRRSTFSGPGRKSDHADDSSDATALLSLYEEAEGSNFSTGALRAMEIDARAIQSARETKKRLLRLVPDGPATKSAGPKSSAEEALLRSILAAYPDRVAKRLKPRGTSLALAGGGTAELSEESVVRHGEWMVVLDGEERKQAGRPSGIVARRASSIEPEWIIDCFPDEVEEKDDVVFDSAKERVEARSQLRYDGLVLTESKTAANSEAVARALGDAAWQKGAHSFAPEGELVRLRARTELAHRIDPNISLLEDPEIQEALRAMADGKRTFAEMRAMSLIDVLRAGRPAKESARIEALAPDRVTLMAGRTVRIQYELGGAPHIESRLQDFFGMRITPTVGGGAIPIVLHLLAPNMRAVQVTSDLPGFWERHYPAIRKELSRKYPRHKWPESGV